MIENDLFFSFLIKKVESLIEYYSNDWKKIEGFILFSKKSVNWICHIKDDYQKNCAVNRFLIAQADFRLRRLNGKKIDVFILFIKENEELFKFTHEFYAVSERKAGWKSKDDEWTFF